MPSSQEVLDKLIADGWVLKSEKGSHRTLKKPGVPLLITIPHPRKDLSIGVLKSAERASGLKLR